jgi:tetratricopeptide (TPR) repeat protein
MRYLDKLPALDDVHYYFTHGLYRDVAYSTLLEEQKQALHAGLAARLELVFADRIHQYYELLAFHYARAANPQKAVYYLVKAADRQTGLGEAGAAVENYQEAIELLRGQAASAARQTLMARLLIRCARLQRTLGNGDQADEMLEGALVCAGSLGNERLILEARLEETISILWRGEYEEAIGALDDLAEQAGRLDARAPLMVALNAMGVAHWQQGHHEKALEMFQKLAQCGEHGAAPQVQADAFNNAGLIYWRWGQYTQALRAYKRALPLRRQAGDQFGLCATLMNMGIIQEQIGQAGAARKSYENACRLAHKTGYVQALAALESNLSNLERRLGNALAAIEHAAHSIEYAQLCEDPNLESIAQENMALARAARGEAEEAATHLARALELAREQKNAERETEVRLSILQTRMEAGLGESSAGVPPAEAHKVKPGVLEEINDLLKAIEQNRYNELLPRAYRIKARILDALDAVNARTAREYLNLAQEKAREAGNFFEELESWQAALEFAGRHADAALAADCARKIEAMKKMMER